ncbi:hypothetical protein HNC20_23330 [Rhodococcus rhodochrous]|uniref:hypothetical protein n=1 Tax=Rhodococcus rhodochrous TaxID=1829 RepID=UPI000751785D|nr:hypothetical protein [Rhodococcus rhodochrous]MDO1486860.1 hypothetical protein [Rhodococcus rhodochrous]
MSEMNEDPIPSPVEIDKLSANMRVTADALESAEMLVEFAIPQFGALDPAGIQTIDPELGALSDTATADVLKTVADELSDALWALRKAREHMVSVANRADRMYPKA